MTETIIDFTKTKFKKNNGQEIEDLITYITDYTKTGEDMRVIVGCDSKQRNKITIYSLVIVLYDEFRHDGAHVIYLRFTTKKEKDLFTRLMNEAVYSLNLGLWLDEKLEGITKPDFKLNDYDKSIAIRKVELHVDVNPKPSHKSNIAYNAIMGMLCGSGFFVKSKPIAPAASCAADYLAK